MIATRTTPAFEAPSAAEMPTASAVAATPSATSVFQLRKLGFLIGLSPPSRGLTSTSDSPLSSCAPQDPCPSSPPLLAPLKRHLTRRLARAARPHEAGRPLPDPEQAAGRDEDDRQEDQADYRVFFVNDAATTE